MGISFTEREQNLIAEVFCQREQIEDLTAALAAERELVAALDDMLTVYRTGDTRDGAAKAERLALARHRAARGAQR